MFNDLVESVPTQKRTKKPWTLAVSVVFQCVGLGVLILIPLLYTQALPKTLLPQLVVMPLASPATVQLIAHSAPASARLPSFLRDNVFREPIWIPTHTAAIRDDAQPPGEPGSAGAYLGLGDGPILAISPAPPAPLVPAPAAATPAPARRVPVGGVIEDAKLIARIQPVYPPLAIPPRIEGNVVLHAIIAKDGRIAELQVISGHPLLIKAALDAVRQWRYQPTLLNGEPVEVETTITVSFILGR